MYIHTYLPLGHKPQDEAVCILDDTDLSWRQSQLLYILSYFFLLLTEQALPFEIYAQTDIKTDNNQRDILMKIIYIIRYIILQRKMYEQCYLL